MVLSGTREMLSFKQRVAFLRCKRRVTSVARNNRVLVGCVTAGLLVIATRYVLYSYGHETAAKQPASNKNSMSDDQTQAAEKKPDANRPDVQNQEQKHAVEGKLQDHAPAAFPLKAAGPFVEASDPRFLFDVMCVVKSAVGHAGEEIRVLKQTTKEDKLVDAAARASLKAIALRLRGRWPLMQISSVSGHSVDDVTGTEKLFDDSDCKIENLNVGMKQLEVVINPVDSHDELVHDSLHHVTVSACVLYKDEPLAGFIYQPFLRRGVSSIRRHDSDPKQLIIKDTGSDKISLGKEKFAEAKKVLGGSVLPNALSGGLDYAVLSVLLDSTKKDLGASTARTYLRFAHIPNHHACAGDVITAGYRGRLTNFQASKPDYHQSAKDKKMDGVWITMSSGRTDGKIGIVYNKLKDLLK